MSAPDITSCRSRTDADHVARLVDRYFGIRDGELTVGGMLLSEIANEFGTPLFVYDATTIQSKLSEIGAILPGGFKLYYSMKANPNSAILNCFIKHGCGLEVASAGELHQALEAGCPAESILFAGPGKTSHELAAALRAPVGELHVESIDEARCLSRQAGQMDQIANIALRVNPLDTSGGAMQMGGRASPFGIDEESLSVVLQELLTLPYLRVTGVHLFMATQILDASILIAQYRRALSIARIIAKALPYPLERIDFGGGWGTPYFRHEAPLDLEQVARGLQSIADEMKADPWLARAQGVLEPGRFLINEAGLYVTRVIRVKESRGKTFAIVDGGMHHHLAASGNLGQTIKRNYPVGLANKIELPVTEPIDVVGPLCTPLDVLARQVELPRATAGDIFTVFMSGAYARTASPLGFLSHDAPAEVLVSGQKAALIRNRGRPEDSLRDQVSIFYPTA